MTEAEIMEQINKKKAELDEARASNSTAATKLEEEIKQLESTLTASDTPKRRRRTAFLDECAG